MVAIKVLDMAGEPSLCPWSNYKPFMPIKLEIIDISFIATGLIAGQTDTVIHHLQNAGRLVQFQVRDDI